MYLVALNPELNFYNHLRIFLQIFGKSKYFRNLLQYNRQKTFFFIVYSSFSLYYALWIHKRKFLWTAHALAILRSFPFIFSIVRILVYPFTMVVDKAGNLPQASFKHLPSFVKILTDFRYFSILKFTIIKNFWVMVEIEGHFE